MTRYYYVINRMESFIVSLGMLNSISIKYDIQYIWMTSSIFLIKPQTT